MRSQECEVCAMSGRMVFSALDIWWCSLRQKGLIQCLLCEEEKAGGRTTDIKWCWERWQHHRFQPGCANIDCTGWKPPWREVTCSWQDRVLVLFVTLFSTWDNGQFQPFPVSLAVPAQTCCCCTAPVVTSPSSIGGDFWCHCHVSIRLTVTWRLVLEKTGCTNSLNTNPTWIWPLVIPVSLQACALLQQRSVFPPSPPHCYALMWFHLNQSKTTQFLEDYLFQGESAESQWLILQYCTCELKHKRADAQAQRGLGI